MMRTFEYHTHISDSHPCFHGHFPNFPILPAVAQLAILEEALWACLQQPGVLISGIPHCKFIRPVLPNTSLSIVLQYQQEGRMLFRITSSEEQLIAKGSFHYKVEI